MQGGLEKMEKGNECLSSFFLLNIRFVSIVSQKSQYFTTRNNQFQVLDLSSSLVCSLALSLSLLCLSTTHTHTLTQYVVADYER